MTGHPTRGSAEASHALPHVEELGIGSRDATEEIARLAERTGTLLQIGEGVPPSEIALTDLLRRGRRNSSEKCDRLVEPTAVSE